MSGPAEPTEAVQPAAAPDGTDAVIDAAAAAGRRAPDFFVLGHQKCGTTALHIMLGAHPQIFMPSVKEPRFLATDLTSPLPPRTEHARRLRTLDGYLSLFADARPDQRIGEASPQYLRSREAPANISALQPDARLIAIFREPASFLRSFHLQMVSSNVEDERDLGRALALEGERRQGRRIPRECYRPQSLLYSEHVRYVEQLRRYEQRFPSENLLVVVYDDLRDDNEGTLLRILRFLDVDDTAPLEIRQTKTLEAVRSPWMHRLANAARTARHRPEAAGLGGRALNAVTPSVLRHDGVKALWRRAAYKTAPPPDPELMRELRRRFRPEVEALGEHIGRDLIALWGYDGLD
jgi:hypothetical protein